MSLHKSPYFHPWAGYALAAVMLFCDLITKYWVSASLQMHERVEVVPFFDITRRHNHGAAFSFLADQGGWQVWFFGVLASAVSIGLIFWIAKLPKRKTLEMLGLSMVLGGALGNLYDRVTLGYVVDFLLVYYEEYQFPAFNVADSAITVGAAMLILDYVLESRRGNSGEKQAIN